MDKTISIRVGEQLDGFIDAQVIAGRYSDAHDVVAAGLRLLQEQTDELAKLQADLLKGGQSGTSARDVQEIWSAVKERSSAAGA